MEITIKSNFETLITVVDLLISVLEVNEHEQDLKDMLVNIGVGVNDEMLRYSESSVEHTILHGCLGYINLKTGLDV